MIAEIQNNTPEKKGSGFRGLILFAVVSFAVCFAGIYVLSHIRQKKQTAFDKEQTSTGFFEGNTFFHPELGWRLIFPQGMILQDHSEMLDWERMPQISGFENSSDAKTNLFLALGNAFSVVGFACLESVEDIPSYYTREQIVAEAQEKLRQTIDGTTLFQCDSEVNDVLIDQVPFKKMSLVFLYQGEEQKRQVIFSTLIDKNLLHVTVVYYNALSGNQLISAIENSSFER